MNEIAVSEDDWDQHILDLGGHFLQSRRWAEFKSLQGWSARRVAVGNTYPLALAQILIRSKGPAGVGYIPRGPAVAEGIPLPHVFNSELDAICRRSRVLYLFCEPDREIEGLKAGSQGWKEGPDYVQPSRTVKIPLLDDELLLQQMHKKTRYSIRLAERRGVVVDAYPHDDEKAMETFHQLLLETSERNQFGVHDLGYYRDFLQVMKDDAVLLIATVNGYPAATLISVCFGHEATYMYGASSTEHRAQGAAFRLQFEAMRWARSRGMQRYDLWGIPKDPGPEAETEQGEVPGSKGDDWRGLYRFKTRFGGDIVNYPPTLERHPVGPLSLIAKRYVGNRQ